jgi:hypothetical protein
VRPQKNFSGAARRVTLDLEAPAVGATPRATEMGRHGRMNHIRTAWAHRVAGSLIARVPTRKIIRNQLP